MRIVLVKNVGIKLDKLHINILTTKRPLKPARKHPKALFIKACNKNTRLGMPKIHKHDIPRLLYLLRKLQPPPIPIIHRNTNLLLNQLDGIRTGRVHQFC